MRLASSAPTRELSQEPMPDHVTIGSTALTVAGTQLTYAGFVPGSIAGLYQINVAVPTGIGTGTSAAQFPVVVTVGSGGTAISSQAGVSMWVK